MGIVVKIRLFNMKYNEWIDQDDGFAWSIRQTDEKRLRYQRMVRSGRGSRSSIRLVAAVPLLANIHAKSVHLDI
jgi:hypothetical protein